ncbi:MAG: polysaccharide deacetylase family protein [bacterium]
MGAAACPATAISPAPAWVITVDADNCASDQACTARADAVSRAVHDLLDLFDEHAVRATFFVCAGMARERADLLREMRSRGHEVACHGRVQPGHGRSSPAEFRTAAADLKRLIEDTLGAPAAGYRTAGLALSRWTTGSLGILSEQGFAYDSSLNHSRERRMPHTPVVVRTEAGPIVEVPMSDVRELPGNLMCAGAGPWSFEGGPRAYAATAASIRPMLPDAFRFASSRCFQTVGHLSKLVMSDSSRNEVEISDLGPRRSRLWRYLHELEAY